MAVGSKVFLFFMFWRGGWLLWNSTDLGHLISGPLSLPMIYEFLIHSCPSKTSAILINILNIEVYFNSVLCQEHNCAFLLWIGFLLLFLYLRGVVWIEKRQIKMLRKRQRHRIVRRASWLDLIEVSERQDTIILVWILTTDAQLVKSQFL